MAVIYAVSEKVGEQTKTYFAVQHVWEFLQLCIGYFHMTVIHHIVLEWVNDEMFCLSEKKKSWWNTSFHAVPIWGRRVNAWNTCLQDVAHSWRQQNGGRNCASENALYLVTLVFVVCDSWIVLCQSASDSAHVTVVLGIITILRRDVSSSQTMQLYISANSG